MMRASLRQIDQDDVRVVAQTVEDDFFAIGCDVERADHPIIAEASERVSLLRGEIEHPEIPRRRPGHETRPVPLGRKRWPPPLPVRTSAIRPGHIRLHSEADPAANHRRNYQSGAIRRPHWIDHFARYEAWGARPSTGSGTALVPAHQCRRPRSTHRPATSRRCHGLPHSEW